MTNLTDDLEVLCISCNTAVSSEDVNHTIGVAKCNHCDSVFRFEAKNQVEEKIGHANAQTFMDKMLQSEHFVYTALLVFMVFWNISFLIFLATCISKGYTALSVILGVVTAIGIYLTYFVVAALFGSSEINAPSMEIGKIVSAFPIIGGRTEVITNLHSFSGVVSERYRIARHQNQSRTAFKVRGVNQKGEKVDLVSGVSREQQVFEIEDKIRNFVQPSDNK